MKRVIEVSGKSGNEKFKARVEIECGPDLTADEFGLISNSIRNDVFNVARKDHGYGFYFNCHQLKAK